MRGLHFFQFIVLHFVPTMESPLQGGMEHKLGDHITEHLCSIDKNITAYSNMSLVFSLSSTLNSI